MQMFTHAVQSRQTRAVQGRRKAKPSHAWKGGRRWLEGAKAELTGLVRRQQPRCVRLQPTPGLHQLLGPALVHSLILETATQHNRASQMHFVGGPFQQGTRKRALPKPLSRAWPLAA